MQLIAVTAFGLEAVAARELQQLGCGEQTTRDGRVRFTGDAEAIVQANLRLRSAERVLVEVGEFEARDFGELFDRTKALPWEEWIAADAAFPVTGRSVRSQLASVPDCQRLVKKAIVERLRSVRGGGWLTESGPEYHVDVSLLRDRATLTIDTSGAGLHKRGYRRLVGRAPLRETLAAGLVQLSYWNRGRPLIDPFCGSGTIPIEAALIGCNIAPGLNREFAAEAWPQIPSRLWQDLRAAARRRVQPGLPHRILGTDIDADALKSARRHAEAAGVADEIHFECRDVAQLQSSRSYGCLISNPPYGERVGDREEAAALYRALGRVTQPLETWSVYVLTSSPQFEREFGRRAQRRRKLYNARIPCTYYQFPGPRPQRSRRSSV